MTGPAHSNWYLLRQWLSIAPRAPRKAARIAFWTITRRRVRARAQLRSAFAELAEPYPYWIVYGEAQENSEAAFAEPLSDPTNRPLVSVLAFGPAEDTGWLHQLVERLQDQPYPAWELLVVGQDVAGLPVDPRLRPVTSGNEAAFSDRVGAAVSQARGDWMLPLRSGDALSRHSLVQLIAASRGGSCDLIYGDEDRIDPRGRRRDPWFKPSWNEELALSQDLLTGACLLRGDAVRTLAATPLPVTECTLYWLAMRVALWSAEPPRHVAHVVLHRLSDRESAAARRPAVEALLAGRGAAVALGDHDTVRVEWPLPTPSPLVSIVIPTRNRRDLLEPCVESVRTKTLHDRFEILIVDNGSDDPDTIAYLHSLSADPRITVLPFDEPYNYSRINNFAVRDARGEYICLLNNDTQVIVDDWLSLLLRQASRAHVGAAGAKLLYDDGTIQHAGVVIGMGNAAGHAHRHLPDTERGYHALAHSTHYVSAVTAACLLVGKAKFESVGGLDEVDLRIAYNDVDLCLKLQDAGWRNVYVPDAVLFHHESKSRGSDLSPENRQRYGQELATLQERWDTIDRVDPMHHPHLDRASETYRIKI